MSSGILGRAVVCEGCQGDCLRGVAVSGVRTEGEAGDFFLEGLPLALRRGIVGVPLI